MTIPTQDEAISLLFETVSSNNERRSEAIEMVTTAVKKIDMEALHDKRASEIEASMGMVSTMDSLMKSQDKAVGDLVKIIGQQKSTEVASDMAAVVKELLHTIKPGMTMTPTASTAKLVADDDTLNSEIEAIYDERIAADAPITSDELLEHDVS